MPKVVIEASAPPATTTSAIPRRIHSAPSPMALAEAEHAVTTHDTGPNRLCSIEASPAAMLGMIRGTPVGLTRSGPRSIRVVISSMNEPIPPNPAPTMTPARAAASSSSAKETPDCSSAWRTATRKNWV